MKCLEENFEEDHVNIAYSGKQLVDPVLQEQKILIELF
jgi:hypothetical protein